MLLKFLTCCTIVIWSTVAQGQQNFYGVESYTPNDGQSRITFKDYPNNAQDGVSDTFVYGGNTFSRAYPKNEGQTTVYNGFTNNNVVKNNQLKSQNTQAQLSNNAQFQQYSQSQQQSYQHNSQYPQSYNAQTQAQQNFYQQSADAQQQTYQQQAVKQQHSLHQNTQPQQQQTYLQSSQPEQQSYQYNAGAQQQFHQQTNRPYQSYDQNHQSHIGASSDTDYYSETKNSQSSTDKAQKFGGDITRTGKPKQNANYNNATFAITKFGLSLFKSMSDYKNVVVSPYSVAMLLALVQQGAQYDSQREITQLLHLTPESSAKLFKSLNEFMKKRRSNNILKVANNVVVSNKFNLNAKFKSTALNNFGSDVTPMDFNNPYAVIQNLNSWVATRTGEKIKELLAPEAIQQDTLAMLLNAVYFKGKWDIKFDPEMTKTKDFTLSDGTKKPAQFMKTHGMFPIDIDPVLKSYILLMPFEGSQYSMMFIMPFEGVYTIDVLSSLTEPQLYSYQKIKPKEVKVEIPKFNIKMDSDILYLLNRLGLWQIFSTQADLSGIGSDHGVSPRITSGVHSALLSIDEQGGTAAAATAFSVVALSYDDPTTSFKADRPFIAILWDNELSMPLFMSLVEDPSE